ncbi:MAG: FtsX-like permease family protein [Alphaproteobacteria bacterium]
MSSWRLALNYAMRDLRHGLRGFRIFLAALLLGVAAIAGVGSLSAALLAGIAEQGQAILGGELEARLSYRTISDDELAFLQHDAEQFSAIATMRAMGKSPRTDKRTPIELKAVDNAYPLYGEMLLQPGGAATLEEALGTAGNWGAVVDEALMVRLGLELGDLVEVNRLQVPVRAVIKFEPDRAAEGFSIGPRVMIPMQALDDTGLIQLGSMVRYHYRVDLVPGVDPDVKAAQALEQFPAAGWRIQTSSNAAPGLKVFVLRTATFLTLVGLTALIIGGVGVSNAVRSWLDRQRDTIATMKCMGASGGFIFAVYLSEIFVIAGIGIVGGVALGALVPIGAAAALEGVLPVPARIGLYPLPLIAAALYGFLIAFLFAIWPLAKARDIPAARLFRALVSPDRTWPRLRYQLMAGLAFAALLALALFTAENMLFAALFAGGVLAAFLILRLAGQGITALARRAPRSNRVILRLAISNLYRPGAPTASIVLSMGLGLTLLSMVALMEGNINQQIANEVPDTAPSFFFIDIQANQVDEFDDLVASVPGTADLMRVPSLRGKIVSIKGVPAEDAPVAAEAQWALRGDRGLTYAAVPPDNSSIVQGAWWDEDWENYGGPPLVSFDEELALGMGMQIGDEITFNILGRNVTAKLASMRRINWSGMGINFSTVFHPKVLVRAPHTHLATVRASDDAEETLYREMTDRFPNITTVRVKEAIAAANDLLQSLSIAVRATGLVTLLAGVLVLGGAVAAGHQARVYDAVMLKVLGASRRDVMAAYLLEYALLGTATAIVAAACGTLGAYVVVTEVMETTFRFLPVTLLSTMVGAIIFTTLFGLGATLMALRVPSAGVLRTA